MILVNVLHPFATKFELQLCSLVNVEFLLELGWHWLCCRHLPLHKWVFIYLSIFHIGHCVWFSHSFSSICLGICGACFLLVVVFHYLDWIPNINEYEPLSGSEYIYTRTKVSSNFGEYPPTHIIAVYKTFNVYWFT